MTWLWVICVVTHIEGSTTVVTTVDGGGATIADPLPELPVDACRRR